MDKRKKQRLIAAVSVFAAAAVVVSGVAGARLYQQKKQTEAQIAARYESSAGTDALVYDGEDGAAGNQNSQGAGNTEAAGSMAASSVSLKENKVEYREKSYVRNTAVKAILVMGVDKSGDMESGEGNQTENVSGKDADGVFLLAHNTADSTVKILQIPRDTMTPITMKDMSGNVLGQDVQHLTLAFAYGDGREESCEFMEEAVSGLLDGLPIDNYMAVSMDVITILNDALGGVPVTIETDGLEAADPAFIKGAEVLLQGKQAERFVRYRDITEDNTALTRMDRQRQYMKAFEQKLIEASKKDSGTVARMFDSIQPYMITDMQKGEYLRMAMDVLGSQVLQDSDFYLLPGEAVVGQFKDEYHPYPEQVTDMVLELFFREQ